MRLRILVIMIGAFLVVAAFSFPYWQRFVQDTPEEIMILFPGLPVNQQSDFASLPLDQQQAYLQLSASNPTTALRMVTSALEPRIPLPEEDQAMLEMNAPVPIAAGRFTPITPIRWGQGRVTLFQSVDNVFVLRFEDFSMPNGPDLRVVLSALEAPDSAAAMNSGITPSYEVGPLLTSFGSQNYELPVGFNPSAYRSVVIYSGALDIVYTVAPLSIRQ